MTQNLMSGSGNCNLALQLAILTRYIVLCCKDDPNFNIREWKLQSSIATSNFDPIYSIAPAKIIRNMTSASGNWDIALQPAILYLAIYDLLGISQNILQSCLQDCSGGCKMLIMFLSTS